MSDDSPQFSFRTLAAATLLPTAAFFLVPPLIAGDPGDWLDALPWFGPRPAVDALHATQLDGDEPPELLVLRNVPDAGTRIEALDDGGALRWSADLPAVRVTQESPRTRISGDTLLIGQHDYADAGLAAFDLGDRTLRWTAMPEVRGGVHVLASESVAVGIPESGEPPVVGVDVASGERLWRLSDRGFSFLERPRPAIVGDHLFGWDDYGLDRVHLATGTVRRFPDRDSEERSYGGVVDADGTALQMHGPRTEDGVSVDRIPPDADRAHPVRRSDAPVMADDFPIRPTVGLWNDRLVHARDSPDRLEPAGIVGVALSDESDGFAWSTDDGWVLPKPFARPPSMEPGGLRFLERREAGWLPIIARKGEDDAADYRLMYLDLAADPRILWRSDPFPGRPYLTGESIARYDGLYVLDLGDLEDFPRTDASEADADRRQILLTLEADTGEVHSALELTGTYLPLGWSGGKHAVRDGIYFHTHDRRPFAIDLRTGEVRFGDHVDVRDVRDELETYLGGLPP